MTLTLIPSSTITKVTQAGSTSLQLQTSWIQKSRPRCSRQSLVNRTLTCSIEEQPDRDPDPTSSSGAGVYNFLSIPKTTMYSYDLFGASQAREHPLSISGIGFFPINHTRCRVCSALGQQPRNVRPVNISRRPITGRAIIHLATNFLWVGLVLIFVFTGAHGFSRGF